MIKIQFILNWKLKMSWISLLSRSFGPQRVKLRRHSLQGKLRGSWNDHETDVQLPPVIAPNTRWFHFSTCAASGSPPGASPASTAPLRRGRHVVLALRTEDWVNIPAETASFSLIWSAAAFFESLLKGCDNSWGSEMKIDWFFPLTRSLYSHKNFYQSASMDTTSELQKVRANLRLAVSDIPHHRNNSHLDLGQRDVWKLACDHCHVTG